MDYSVNKVQILSDFDNKSEDILKDNHQNRQTQTNPIRGNLCTELVTQHILNV